MAGVEWGSVGGGWRKTVHLYFELNEAKPNERDDKWFLAFPSKMVHKSSEKKSVCNVRMLVYKMQVRLRELLWSILMKQTV